MSFSRTCVAAAVSTLNTGGRVLRGLGQKPPELSPDRLVRSAQRRAQQTDFGKWDVRNPMERLVRAYEEEANLTLLGRLAAREHIVGLLENLLRLERNRTIAPEIELQKIVAPVFIVGLPRTGTTVLHNLISLDTAVRTPLTWEVMYPAGSTETPDDIRRIKNQTTTRLNWADRLAPEFKRIHPTGADLPQECVALMAQGFSSALFHTLYRVPSYQDWFENDSQTLGFDMHHRILQHLQAAGDGNRWVLKGPAHLFSLAPLLKRYPDARLIQTHRDPLRAMSSIASLNTVLRQAFSDHSDPREIGPDWCDRWARALNRFLERRDALPSDRFLDIAYEEVAASPLATVERIYDYLGWSLSDGARTAMSAFLTANPKDKYGKHRYSLEAFGLDRNTELKRFAAYCERFDIPIGAN